MICSTAKVCYLFWQPDVFYRLASEFVYFEWLPRLALINLSKIRHHSILPFDLEENWSSSSKKAVEAVCLSFKTFKIWERYLQSGLPVNCIVVLCMSRIFISLWDELPATLDIMPLPRFFDVLAMYCKLLAKVSFTDARHTPNES